MMKYTAETLAAMASTTFSSATPPSETAIDQFLNGMAGAFSLPPEVVGEARRMIHARLKIRMELGQTLTQDDGHQAWLTARRVSITPFYWTRYRQLLLNTGWSPQVLGTLDQATDTLLDLMGDPENSDPWRRRGLVVGDVQSGKTATYAALICKAADAGYKMVILLTGVLENVRRQTQERLDSSFIGFDSSAFLGNTSSRKQHIGVGLIDGQRDGIVFTSLDHDFRKNAVSALNLSLHSVNEPVLVVTKKNKAVLERLRSWLVAHNANSQGRIDLPLLLIDDEADNASVNTKKDPGDTTAINKAIRNLLAVFMRSSYTGFTATPFANIFIDPATTHAMLGDDLFPNDFIHVLKPPSNYIGMDALFPVVPDPDDDLDGTIPESVIRPLEDGDQWLPSNHTKISPPEALPDSLTTALRVFLLACAIRDLRAVGGVHGKGGGIHRSMLVNASKFTAVQNWIADLLHDRLDEIRTEVRLYGAKPPAQAEADSEIIGILRADFEAEYFNCGYSWDAVLAALYDAIAPVRVQAVNQITGARSLDYTVAKSPPGVRIIAVGGNALSRGLTLEGLSTSYFLRTSRAYDTLLQMGRWFGYRDGYEDLCRVWLTDEAVSWYRHIAVAAADLKSDFAKMARRKATPREFGLRVRTHPDTLLITARNKMATGLDVDVHVDISLVGQGLESARLYGDVQHNKSNLALLESFFGRLHEKVGPPANSPHGGAVIWSRVEPNLVADLLEHFAVHYLNHSFQGDSVAEALRVEVAGGEQPELDWIVVLQTGGRSETRLYLSALPGIEIRPGIRSVKTGDGNSLFVSGKSAKVGGRSDLRHAFTPVELEAAFPGALPANAHDIRQCMSRPMLFIYLLEGSETVLADGEKKRVSYRNGLILPAVALHFPGDAEATGTGRRRTIRYRLNRVAQQQLFPSVEEEDDLPEEDEDD